jgi:hypothetical protein
MNPNFDMLGDYQLKATLLDKVVTHSKYFVMSIYPPWIEKEIEILKATKKLQEEDKKKFHEFVKEVKEKRTNQERG